MNNNLAIHNFPEDIRNMSPRELDLLAYEIRDFLIEKVSKTGGHLASNLGVVELTIAIHKVFNSPVDKLIWDVGHQSYVHKILTGRAAGFDHLREFEGMSGFPKRDESPHDCYDTGHSSTSISAAAGMAAARDLKGENYKVVAIIGDGALTGGMAYEALNNAGASNSNVIVILNDNGMSISKNIGGMSQHLNKLRTSKGYLDFKKNLKKTLKNIPTVGEGIYSGMEHIRDSLKYAIVEGALFEELGFTYMGPINGHNIEETVEALSLAKRMEGPVLVHVITKKGKGYRNAEKYPGKFHGIGPFDPTTGSLLMTSNSRSYSKIFGDKLIELAENDNKIVAVCAAMADGTGLSRFEKEFSNRLFDVGIAEEHAVSFAAAMALSGFKPFVAIYSTFLQRAYDQMMIDVCMQNTPVIFAVDRAGNVGNDGETHHGLFDISYLTSMPNMTVLAPMDGTELEEMMDYALSLKGPVAIRFPRGSEAIIHCSHRKTFNGSNTLLEQGNSVEIWAVGKMVSVAYEVREILTAKGYSVGIVNGAIIKPFDETLILDVCDRTSFIVTLEDNVISGGFGEKLCKSVLEHDIKVKVKNIAWPDKFVEHGDTEILFKKYKLDKDSIAERIREFIEG